MSIQKMLNSMWAVVSAKGSVIKVATQPYNPNPGAGSAEATNQAVAAVNAGSPFITIDQNGLTVGVNTVATSLAGFNSNSGSKLDENSGQYQVLRQYGDIYMYNDGNIISWGGNGKNFNFGNGYEEAHAWANGPYVYNNEQFAIPQGAMSLFLLPGATPPKHYTPPASLADYEWLGGAVSKFWGNEYTYSRGSSYEWNGGYPNYVDAYGNTGAALKDVMQNKHCTFSYGTGYEEALIEWGPSPGGNGTNYFHADDSNSPYLPRPNDAWATSNLGSNWTAANLLVSKAFGPTYDYHKGPGLSVQDGDSEERVFGTTWSYATGDSYETVTGNSTSNVTGNSNETINGNSTSNVTGNSDETVTGNSTSKTVGNKTETYWGLSDEYFMGGKNEMMLAGCDEINLSAKLEIVAGVAGEIFLGAKMEMVLGPRMEMKVGPAIEIAAEPDIKMTPTELKVAIGAKIDALGNKITMAILNLLI